MKITTYRKVHSCDKCDDLLAVWWYMPEFADGSRGYYCDACIPRGCSCNIISAKETDLSIPSDYSLNEDGDYECFESNGRRLPCCEYGYSEEGFEDDNA